MAGLEMAVMVVLAVAAVQILAVTPLLLVGLEILLLPVHHKGQTEVQELLGQAVLVLLLEGAAVLERLARRVHQV